MSALVLAFNKSAAEEFKRRLTAGRGLQNPTTEQQAVIDAQEGVVVVDARPGSGKTATLVSRTLVLDPEADVRTFHSWALREITRNPTNFGFTKRPQVATNGIFGMLCEANGVDYRSWDESGWDQDWIALAERSLYTEELRDEYTEAVRINDLSTARSTKALLTYREWLLSASKVTFDAMVRLVAENRDYLDLSADHVMVDEYQDVDRFQFDLVVRMAALRPDSLCVVGDPNQRIYEWRGALEAAFSSLLELHPGALRLPLSCNFRSLDPIIRFGESICPSGMHGVRGEGHDGVLHTTTDETLFWARLTASEGPPLIERAILCRYNRTCASWQLRLAKAGIPVYLIGRGDFWNLRHVKLVVEYRGKGEPWSALEADYRWDRLRQSRIYQGPGGQEAWQSLYADTHWLFHISADDFKLLQTCLQDEAGVRVSTIHKAKGTEYTWVGIPEVDKRLRKDLYVWYVGVTRAKDQLSLLEVATWREEG